MLLILTSKCNFFTLSMSCRPLMSKTTFFVIVIKTQKVIEKFQSCGYQEFGRSVKCLLPRKEAGEYWPRLTKEKQKIHWLKVDFARWRVSKNFQIFFRWRKRYKYFCFYKYTIKNSEKVKSPKITVSGWGRWWNRG